MNKKKFLGFTSLVSLSFGLMVGCSDSSNPGSANLGDDNLAAASSDANTDLSNNALVGVSSAGTAVIPGISSSSVQGQVAPGVSSSSVGGTTPASSSAFVSESNGNSPAIAYATTGATVTNNNGCVTVTGGEVVISCAGDYDFSGSYKGADAQIRVNSPKADSGVYLNLRGLTLENTVDAPIYVQQASKTFVVAKKETVNTLTDAATRTKSFTYQNSNGVTKTDTTGAAVYAKDDLTIKGEGSLTVNGNYNNGIQCSNDLRFRGETVVNVTAKNNGVKGKGSVQIGRGNLTITTTEGDGIKSDECTENAAGECTAVIDNKGIVEITGGTITVTAADDGISAANMVNISETDGTVKLNIKSGSGIPNTTSNESGPGGGRGGNYGGYGGNNTNNSTSSDASLKGIKAGVLVQVDAGSITIASEKDAIHANSVVKINGGDLSVQGRNGAHADDTIYVEKGNFIITQSYEGLEGRVIQLNGGVTYINATDDGWNASDGNEDNCTNCYVNVTGGNHYAIARGDGLDANYGMNLTGGVSVVAQTGNGNGIFDIGRGSLNVSGSAILLGAGTTDMTVCPSATTTMKATGTYSQGTKIAILEGTSVKGLVVLPFAAYQIQWAYGSGNYTVVTGGTFNGTLVENAFAGEGTLTGGTNVSGSACTSSGMGGGMRW